MQYSFAIWCDSTTDPPISCKLCYLLEWRVLWWCFLQLCLASLSNGFCVILRALNRKVITRQWEKLLNCKSGFCLSSVCWSSPSPSPQSVQRSGQYLPSSQHLWCVRKDQNVWQYWHDRGPVQKCHQCFKQMLNEWASNDFCTAK